MANRVSDWLYRVSTGKITLVALAVFVLFSAAVLPGQSSQARRQGNDAGSPDTSFWYSPSDLYRIAEAYGKPGRQAYIRARFTFDLVWPLVYTFFLGTAVSWLFGKAFAAGSRWRLTNLAPLWGAAFDYLENLSTSLVMGRYPVRTPLADALAPVFTLTKWSLIGGSFVLLLLGAIVGAWRWSQRRHG